MRLEPHQVLLIDSLHGLYDEMTASIAADRKFRLYIETLGQLRNEEGIFMRWADNRLMRRMIRDSWHRNHAPLETITHWHYVRSSELKHIIPFIGGVDFVVNSALPYELPILKPKLYRYFPEAAAACRDNPARQDAYIRASRIAALLDGIEGVDDDSVVPPRSLLREFIGGGEYRY
jgi:uridine kinase